MAFFGMLSMQTLNIKLEISERELMALFEVK